MDYFSAKIITPIALTLGMIAPPALYKASNLYIEAYNTSTNYLTNQWIDGLSYIGLQPKRSELSHETYITNASIKYRIPEKLLTCLITQESAKNSDAFSPKQAIGLAQIMPFNAKRCGLSKISKLWDEETNINCGAQILSEELITYKKNLEKSLQVYNGGPKCIGKCNESINYSKVITTCFAQSML